MHVVHKVPSFKVRLSYPLPRHSDAFVSLAQVSSGYMRTNLCDALFRFRHSVVQRGEGRVVSPRPM